MCPSARAGRRGVVVVPGRGGRSSRRRVVVELAGGEHVPDGDDDRVLDGAERFLVSAAGAEPLVLGGEVGVLGAARGDGGLARAPSRATWSRCGSCRSGACRRIGRCRGRSRPRRRGAWRSGRRSCPAGLGDDHLGGAPLNAGDRAQQLNGLARKGRSAPRSPVRARDRSSRKSMWARIAPIQSAC